MSEKPRGYAHRVDIAADAEKVWLALTKVEHLTRWCSPRALRRSPRGRFRIKSNHAPRTERQQHQDGDRPLHWNPVDRIIDGLDEVAEVMKM